MPQEILRQQNWNGGALDPQMLGRRDLKAYYQSAASIENLIMLAQGPLKRRPGLTFRDLVRRELEAIELTGDMLAAPNGGSAADVLSENADSLTTTAPMGTTDPYVLVTVDFGAPVTVHAVDVIDYGLSEGGVPPGEPGFEYPWRFEPNDLVMLP